MPTVQSLTRQLNYSERGRKFAWAKFFESQREALTIQTTNYRTIERVVESEIPEHLVNELKEDMVALRKEIECPICLNIIIPNDLGVSKCGHKYCKDCLEQLKTQHDPKCAMCRRKL
jgi:late competence protein required for DNA uptake (superfamily II DNA/RNA helicase)